MANTNTPTIFKYPIHLLDEQMTMTLAIPGYIQTLCVQLQNNEPYLWVLCNPGGQPILRTFRVYGTGFPDVMGIYVGTFQQPPFVLHVFEDSQNG